MVGELKIGIFYQLLNIFFLCFLSKFPKDLQEAIDVTIKFLGVNLNN
tara:strand:- start:105 stop:245 length:141 start_codon:yes stop_codon:yes gene_type:complete